MTASATDFENFTPAQRALLALDGLSIGDSLGEQFFSVDAESRIKKKILPPAPWPYTDDTEMAISVTECLISQGAIIPGILVQTFCERYDPKRGYGAGFHTFIAEVRAGKAWKKASDGLFRGQGSFGNGAAMRVAPLGAYFSSDLDCLSDMAERSAIVTHSHPDGVAGAVAVAVAAASSWNGTDFWETILDYTPPGALRRALRRASELEAETPLEAVAKELGVGEKVTALDTVPFALWCAHHSSTFEECFWRTVGCLGDRDTTCAIACGVNVLKTRDVPREWLDARESLPPMLAENPTARAASQKEDTPSFPRIPEGEAALDFQIERIVAFFQKGSPEATWSGVRLFEGDLHANSFVKRQELHTVELYRPRFSKLLDEGHSWINLNASGVLNNLLILSLEWPSYANTCPRELVSVNLSGPYLDSDGTPRWDLSDRLTLVDTE